MGTRSENRVRVRGRVHVGFLPEGRSADDGKRFYSEGRRIATRSENRVRVRGRVHAGFLTERRLADDGKAFTAKDVVSGQGRK